MKQTAVEWLIDQLIFKQEYEHLPNNYFLMGDKDIDAIIQKAKEMENQQIEISDEYIDERAKSHSETSTNKTIAKTYFQHGARWYREHLRQRR